MNLRGYVIWLRSHAVLTASFHDSDKLVLLYNFVVCLCVVLRHDDIGSLICFDF